MKTEDILLKLKEMSSEQTRNIFIKHGAPKNSVYGVKVADLKTLLKPLKGQQEIAMELYESGISDAMYLAALVADGNKMSTAQLQLWAEQASWNMISEYAVPWVASENKQAFELGLVWIDDSREQVAAAGWCTLACFLSIYPDEQIDRNKISELIHRIESNIQHSPNRVKYTMNGFLIAAGVYVRDLNELIEQTSIRIGTVYVDMEGTSCKVPDAISYIHKTIARGPMKKKKTAKC
jgi:3-methyladenine DNA glycosylase AlkD